MELELFENGREIGYEEMRKMGVKACDAMGHEIVKVRSARAVKGGLVVKVLVQTRDGDELRSSVIRKCTKCGASCGEVVEFSGHVNGGFMRKVKG